MSDLSRILFPNKATGDTFTASEVNEIKSKLNALIDAFNLSNNTQIVTSTNKPTQVILDGDSLTFGYGSSNPATTSYPAMLSTLMPSTLYGDFANFGVSGQRSYQALSDAATQVKGRYDFNTYQKAVVVLMIGINDLGHEGASIASIENNVTQYIQDVADSRSQVYLITLPACKWSVTNGSNSPITDAEIQARVNNHNQWIRANALTIGAAGYIDLARDSRFQTPSNSVYYLSDQIHFTDTGYLTVAQIVSSFLLNGIQPTGNILTNTTTVPATPSNLTFDTSLTKEAIVFKDLVNATASDNTVTFAGGNTIWNYSAHSTKAIGSSSADLRGYIEFTINEQPSNTQFVIGLSANASNAIGYEDTQIAIHFDSMKGLRAYGTVTGYDPVQGLGSPWQTPPYGCVCRIQVHKTAITCWVNGTMFYSVNVADNNSNLQLDCSAMIDNSYISNVYIAGANLIVV